MTDATTTTAAPTATVTRFVGICQICEAEHKLTTDAFPSLGLYGEEHKVVHHGYKRPGHGSIVGDCDGVGCAPYEVSCEQTKAYRLRVAQHRGVVIARIAALNAGEILELHERSWRRGEAPTVYTPASPEWARKLASAIREAEGLAAFLGQEIARLDRMIDAWILRPLRTLEEYEAPKRDERAAKKAAKAADYQARTEAKIASYRKRLASARKNRTTSTIADIFESAPRQLGDRGLTAEQAFEAIGSAEVFAAFGLDPAGGSHFRGPNSDVLGAMRMGRFDPTAQRWIPLAWPAELS